MIKTLRSTARRVMRFQHGECPMTLSMERPSISQRKAKSHLSSRSSKCRGHERRPRHVESTFERLVRSSKGGETSLGAINALKWHHGDWAQPQSRSFQGVPRSWAASRTRGLIEIRIVFFVAILISDAKREARSRTTSHASKIRAPLAVVLNQPRHLPRETAVRMEVNEKTTSIAE